MSNSQPASTLNETRTSAHPLTPYIPVCDAIARLFQPHVEVVLHDLASETIFHIANAYSKRRAGDSSLNETDPLLNLAQPVIGPYPKTNWDGQSLKSITAVIRDGEQQPVGLLCINQDVTHFAGLLTQLEEMIQLPQQPQQPKPLFSKDWREGVNHIVGAFLRVRNVTLAGLTRPEADQLLLELDRQGVFEIRNAMPYVAELFQLTRATIYNRLAAVRKTNEE